MFGYKVIVWDKQTSSFHIFQILALFSPWVVKKLIFFKNTKSLPDITILQEHIKNCNHMFGHRVKTQNKSTAHFGQIFALLPCWGF